MNAAVLRLAVKIKDSPATAENAHILLGGGSFLIRP